MIDIIQKQRRFKRKDTNLTTIARKDIIAKWQKNKSEIFFNAKFCFGF